MNSCFILALLVLVYAGSAVAETYKWVDDSGTVNFSDDLMQVPKKYRKKAKPIGDMSAPEPEAVKVESGSDADKAADSSASKEDKGAGGKQEKKDTLYGGKSGETWKQEFAALKAEMKSTDDQISEMNARLQGDTSKMSRTEYLSIKNTIKSIENHRSELDTKFKSLNRAASKANVPSEFR